jgi:hypothetical protein
MNILEKDIEDLLWYGITTDRNSLREKGFYVPQHYHYCRQLDIGNYGRIDILGIDIPLRSQLGDREIGIHLIELKKEEVNAGTFLQAIRYCNGIKRLIENELNNCFVSFRIDLIGKTICTSDFIYLPNLFENIGLFTYKIDYKNGIIFNREENYNLTNEAFPSLSEWKYVARHMLKRKMEARDKVDDLPF